MGGKNELLVPWLTTRRRPMPHDVMGAINSGADLASPHFSVASAVLRICVLLLVNFRSFWRVFGGFCHCPRASFAIAVPFFHLLAFLVFLGPLVEFLRASWWGALLFTFVSLRCPF